MDSITENQLWLLQRRQVVRIYLNGLIMLVGLYVVWRVTREFLPFFEILGNSTIAFILTGLAILLLPLFLGSLVVYLVNPLLGRWQTWSQVMDLEQKLLSELERGRIRPVVMVDWPDSRQGGLRGLGVLTNRFYNQAEDGIEMGSVYLPSGPRRRGGVVVMVPVDRLAVTNWSVQHLQVFLQSYGAIESVPLEFVSWKQWVAGHPKDTLA